MRHLPTLTGNYHREEALIDYQDCLSGSSFCRDMIISRWKLKNRISTVVSQVLETKKENSRSEKYKFWSISAGLRKNILKFCSIKPKPSPLCLFFCSKTISASNRSLEWQSATVAWQGAAQGKFFDLIGKSFFANFGIWGWMQFFCSSAIITEQRFRNHQKIAESIN